MKNRKGFLLIGVLLTFLLLLIIVPVMVKWVQNDTKISVKDQKAGIAFDLAEAAVDRGYWKVKSSTSTFAGIMNGVTIAGYRFDATYPDIPGGTYRISISSGPDKDQVTVVGEGRDSLLAETRAIRAVYLNATVPGPVLSAGNFTQATGSVVHWGPVMAVGDITVAAGSPHYPRKISRHVVKGDTGVTGYDTNGTDPPNTDNKEWWSNYNVPDLPVFDFAAMRSSAAATGTLNCTDITTNTYTPHNVYTPNPLQCAKANGTKYNNTCGGSGGNTFAKGNTNCTTGTTGTCNVTGVYYTTTTALMMACCHSDAGGNIACDYDPATTPYQYSVCYLPGDLRPTSSSTSGDPRADKDYTWFWDNSVTIGSTNTYSAYCDTSNNGIAIRGTLIVQSPGSLTLWGNDDYPYTSAGPTLPVPPNAWKEYQYSPATAWPGRLTNTTNSANYVLGSCGSTCEGGATGSDLGIWGFLYVGGPLAMHGSCDVYGAIWANGAVSGADNTNIFYNSNLKVPTLNVVLQRASWKETTPSSAVWP